MIKALIEIPDRNAYLNGNWIPKLSEGIPDHRLYTNDTIKLPIKEPKKRIRKGLFKMKHTTVLKFWLNTTREVLTGIPFKVAGGYPRDLYFGVEPKDIDFFVRYNENTVEEILTRLKQLELPHKVCSEVFGEEDDEGYPTEEGEEPRISEVIKVGGCVDIIFINHPISKTIENFDFNLNQFELGMMDEPVYKGKPHNNILEIVTDCALYKDDEELHQDRIRKIAKKADELGWVCSQKILDLL